jgi:iron complex transport system substrate-binding protein
VISALVLAAALGLLPAAHVAAARPEPIRVATLVPYVTAALERAGGRAQIVATVRTQLLDPVEVGWIDLGSPHSPSFERLAEARAQIVIGDRLIHAPLAEKLRALGGEVLLVDGSSVDATLQSLIDVAERLEGQREMERAVKEARTAIDGVALERPLRVLALLGTPAGFFAFTRQTWLGDLLARLHFANVAAAAVGSESAPGFVQLTDEVLGSLDPELVVLVTHGDPQAVKAAFVQKLEARGLAGGRGHAVLRVVGEPFTSNPGLELGRAAHALAALADGAAAAAPVP